MRIKDRFPLVVDALLTLDPKLRTPPLSTERVLLLLNEIGFSLGCPAILSTHRKIASLQMLEKELHKQTRKEK